MCTFRTALVALLCPFLTAALNADEDLLFPTPQSLAGQAPYSLVVVHLDQDDHLDVAATDRSGGAVVVVLGNGDGTFGPPQSFPVGGLPVHVVAADLNGDGALDLVTANNSTDDVSVLLGNGNGDFAPAVDYMLVPGSTPYSVALADLDGGGAVDMVVGNSRTDNVSVYLGNGDGTFADPVIYEAGNSPRWVSLADLNGDSIPDLLTADTLDDDVSVRLGNGDGTFGFKGPYPTGNGPEALALADLDGNGTLDVATSNDIGDTVSILLGAGDGSLGAFANTPASNGPQKIAFGDADLDGLADLVVPCRSSDDVHLMKGLGDGTVVPARTIPTTEQPQQAVIADVDEDGRPDVVVTDSNDTGFGDGELSVHLGLGGFQFGALSHDVNSQVYSCVLEDFDLDGHLDVAAANEFADDVSILLGIGNGQFVTLGSFPTGLRPRAIAAEDFNGDGLLDLVTANRDSNDATVLLGQPGGSFGAPASFPSATQPTHVVVGDVDQDGLQDFVVTCSGLDVVSVHIGNGDGTFEGAFFLALQDTFAACSAIGDFTDDGIADIVVASSDPTFDLFRGQGGGKFSVSESVYTGSGGGQRWVVGADVTDDGRTDLVYTINESVRYVASEPGGTFAQPVDFDTDEIVKTVTVEDLDVDGNLDLIVSVGGRDAVWIYFGLGAGAFAAPVDFACGARPRSERVGDLNGDGAPDIVTGGETDSTVMVLLNQHPPGTTLCGNPEVISVGDGGTQAFEIDAGAGEGGNFYFLLGSLSGTSPGIPIGAVLLPLNVDAYFNLTVSGPNQPPLKDSFGTLDGAGTATGIEVTLPPGVAAALVGQTVHHAALLISPFGLITLATNPVAVELIP